jgi:hypothetical protein
MIGERTMEGWEARMRPSGVVRFIPAAFLTFWLCGWAAGEGFALWFLGQGAMAFATGQPLGSAHSPMPTGVALAIGAFLIFWLSLWTLGGIAAMGELLRLVWSEDRIVASAAGITLHTSRGPFHKTVEIPRDQVVRIVPTARGCALAVETTRATVELTRHGSPSEREEVAQGLRSELGLREDAATPATGYAPGLVPAETAELPPGWEDAIAPEGERVLVRSARTRARQVRVVGVIAFGAACLGGFVAYQASTRAALIPPAVIVAVFAIGLAWVTFWLAAARVEWKIGNGRITLRQRFHGQVRDLFEADRLELLPFTDSDRDERYVLMAVNGQGSALTSSLLHPDPRYRRLVDSSLHDAVGPRRLGMWLARAAGIPFADRTGAAAREADLAALTAQLEATGPLGRFAARLVTRSRERTRKSA